jgi:tetratricopeptide (TPR) repeat protein
MEKEPASLWAKMAGGVMAGTWSRSQNPPVGPDKAPLYAAALSVGGLTGAARDRVARALLHCDAEAGSYTLERLHWYGEAFSAFPDDEQCAFFVASLGHHKVLRDPELIARAYAAVLLNRSWSGSIYWKRWDLPRPVVEKELARHYAVRALDPSTVPAEQVAFVEQVFDRLGEGTSERATVGQFLCRVYRAQGRQDERAQAVFAAVLIDAPEDEDNDAFLARTFVEQGRYDATACAVFARMVAAAEARSDVPAVMEWLRRLAHAYIEVGRVDDGSLPVLRRAAAVTLDDPLIESGLLYAVARKRTGVLEEDELFINRLERAVTEREEELQPLFRARRWDWGLVVRALAIAWGHSGRIDAAALAVYERATDLSPEDRTLWALRARALAEAKTYDEAAMGVYERARQNGQANDAVLIALGRTYVEVGAASREDRRREAIALWEDLFRQGMTDNAMIAGLAEAYTADDRVNDVALALWERAVEADPENGMLRLRLGREWRLRGEADAAARWLREAAKRMPKSFEAQYEAGLLLNEHYGDHAGAARHLGKAVKLPGGGSHLNAHFALGESLLFLERRDEAKAVFEKVVNEIDGQHTPTLLHLARLNLKYEEQGVRRAEELYEQALQLDPEHPETYRKMADLYREKGQVDAELEALEKYLTLSDPDADRYRQLSDLYLRRGDFIRAEGALRQVIALGKGDKKLYTQLGEIILQAQAQAERERVAGVSKGGPAPIPDAGQYVVPPPPASEPVPAPPVPAVAAAKAAPRRRAASTSSSAPSAPPPDAPPATAEGPRPAAGRARKAPAASKAAPPAGAGDDAAAHT